MCHHISWVLMVALKKNAAGSSLEGRVVKSREMNVTKVIWLVSDAVRI